MANKGRRKAGQAEEGGAGGRASARPRRAWKRPRRLGQCRPGRAAKENGQPGPPGEAGERGLRRRRTDRAAGPKGRGCAPPRAGGRSPAPARLSFKPPSLPPIASPTRSGRPRPDAAPVSPLSPGASAASPSPWDASVPRWEERRRPLPQLPRVESLAFPSVPATLRHYRLSRSSTRRLGVPNWSEESSIPHPGGGTTRNL